MRKGYLHSVVWIVLTLVLALLCLYWLPDVTIAGWTMRKVDILADLRTDTTSVPDTVITLKPKVKIDSCKPGMTCINDFSDNETGMEPFYKALDNIGSLGRPVRIAVLGDSYIEGDILTADLRSLFQQRFGGCGVGYVAMSSETAGFRRSVRQYSSGWDTHNANDHTGYESTYATLTGHYSYATSGASTTLNCVRYLPKLDSCDNTSLYFVARGGAQVKALVNGTTPHYFTLSPSSEIQAVTVNDGRRIGRVTWSVESTSGQLVCIGASLDGNRGVAVDNYSLRSASGQHLLGVSDQMYQLFDKARHYDLVVVMYGLNVAGTKASSYKAYRQRMEQAIKRMRQQMPGTGFLLVSVGDREERSGGAFHTMRGVQSLVNVQQYIAFDTKIAFWNLYTAMGGEGSIVQMVNSNPPLANLDYTHINFLGGRKLGKLLYEAMEWGYENYKRQNEQ